MSDKYFEYKELCKKIDLNANYPHVIIDYLPLIKQDGVQRAEEITRISKEFMKELMEKFNVKFTDLTFE